MGINLSQKTYLLITGASRGIGQEMAIQLANKLKPDSVLVLMARSTEGLAKTKTTIAQQNKDIKVLTYSIDLGKAKAEQFVEILEQSLIASAEVAGNFENSFIIHNAGSVGDVSKHAKDVADTTAWTEYYHMNLFSAVSLNCAFMKLFAAVPKLIVNISSLCGIQPFASMSYYCSVKAARDMYFRVLAVEEANDTVVLNYAPGAIETDMTLVVQTQTFDSALASNMKEQRDAKTMLTTDKTTKKFIQILEEQKFKSGDHVDYWDN